MLEENLLECRGFERFRSLSVDTNSTSRLVTTPVSTIFFGDHQQTGYKGSNWVVKIAKKNTSRDFTHVFITLSYLSSLYYSSRER